MPTSLNTPGERVQSCKKLIHARTVVRVTTNVRELHYAVAIHDDITPALERIAADVKARPSQIRLEVPPHHTGPVDPPPRTAPHAKGAVETARLVGETQVRQLVIADVGAQARWFLKSD